MQKLLLTAICIIASLQLPAQDISTNDVNETDWVIEEEVVTEPDGFIMAFTENKKWQLLGVFLDKNGLGYTK